MTTPGSRGHSPARQHSLGGVSAETAGAAPPDDDSAVRVPQAFIRRMRELPPLAARAVADAILDIPAGRGMPIRLDVPGDPPGTRYRALLPDSEQAPAVIYRESLPGEEGRWLVTALMDRDAYRAYTSGLAESTVVQGVAAAVAAGTISASVFAASRKR
jgi:hypothetical protein